MALIDKTSIGTGNTIQAEHITRIIDALNESGSYDIIATGSFTGSFTGDGSGLTGVTVTSTPSATSASYAVTASHALYAVSASYEINYETSSSYADFAQTASYITVAQTASYVTGAHVDGAIALATSSSYADFAQTASYVVTAQSASYIDINNIDGEITATTASYILGSNVSGAVATATSSSYSTNSKQLERITRTVYEFTTTDATPYVQDSIAGSNYGRYIKAIVIGNSSAGSLGGEFTKFYDVALVGGTTELSSTGTLSDNIAGTPLFSISDVAQFTATGVAATTIDWRVIIEQSDI